MFLSASIGMSQFNLFGIKTDHHFEIQKQGYHTVMVGVQLAFEM